MVHFDRVIFLFQATVVIKWGNVIHGVNRPLLIIETGSWTVVVWRGEATCLRPHSFLKVG